MAILFSVVIAAVLSLALLTLATAAYRRGEDRLSRDLAMTNAEAGLARALAEANLEINRANPYWPPQGLKISGSDDSRGIVMDASDGTSALGSFEILFLRGDRDGIDNDGDGLLDGNDSDEADFVTAVSTGYGSSAVVGNRHEVRLMGIFQKVTDTFTVPAAVVLQDPSPDIDIAGGDEFTISGLDHDLYSKAVIAGAPRKPALATTGEFDSDDSADILLKASPSPGPALITGASPIYRNYSPGGAETAALVEFARTHVAPEHLVVGSGKDIGGPFGTPPGYPSMTPPVWDITFHDAGGPGHEVKFDNDIVGAGLWVVDGDLTLNSECEFTGLLVVTGKVQIFGKTTPKTLLGSLVLGESVSVASLRTDGSVDILYSSTAVSSLGQDIGRYQLRAWRKLSAQ